jgi:DNA-binding CsgD family transcriptional regulator/PAS domain-containing protein
MVIRFCCRHALHGSNRSMSDAAFSRMLDAIYDATTSFDRWPAALEHLGAAFACSYVGLIDRNVHTMEGRAIAIGIDAAGQRDYFENWSRQDVLRLRTPAYRAGTVETDQDILSRAELLGSDYYNGFMRRHDMHAYMRMTLSVESGSRKIISLARSLSAGDYAAADTEQCRRLLPHFQRAARVMQRVEDAGMMLDAASDVLEQNASGVFLIDRAGRIVFANRRARSLAQSGEGLALRHNRVEAVNSQEDATLRRLIAGATGKGESSDAPRAGGMRLSRGRGKPDLSLAVGPLSAISPWRDDGPAAFILVTEPNGASARSSRLLQQIFGLSAAEVRVAQRLMLGETPEEAAASLGIKISTLRWHLASLYRKTDTRRQAELVRLLLTLPVA